jgi:uncharacterized membrane protein
MSVAMAQHGIRLWACGIIAIGVGAAVTQFGPSISGPLTPEEQGEALGMGIVAMLMWVVGVTLIVVSIVKAVRSRNPKRHPPEP